MLTGQAHAALPPIEVIKKVPPKPGVFKDASQTKPIVIRSEKDAAEYFSDLSVALLNKKVDFKQQIVLVFAWRGSGQDRLTYTVAESFPEQISFIYLPGRTRDLRPHIKIYVLRSNVKWTGPKPNGGPGNTASKPKQITCTVGELKREALVYLPVKKIDNAVPLVFGFHGHGGSSRNAARSFKIHQLWPEAIVVYMQGLPTVGKLTDPKGRRSGWEHSPEQYKGRDLKFFDAILKRLQTDYKIDNQRIYATGHSNGGGFTYLLWAHRPDVFAAIAPSAAASRSLITAKPKPVAVMHLAGRNDRLVRFTWQQLAMKRVRAINGCSDKGSDWAKGCTIYASETNNNAPFVSFIHSGRHRYPTQGPALIVRFFKAHTRKPTTKTEETKNKTD
ncbi:MAG: prolyl oligopeptidase family serine peptidase [bacterium]|nr:prolyl oligopeptidase family serine peptidase [bacterium]